LGGVIHDGKEIKLDQAHLDDLEVKYSNLRNLTRWVLIIVSAIAILSSLYHLYAGIYMPNYQLHLSLHLMFMMTLAFFMYPIWSKTLKDGKGFNKVPIYDWALAIASVAVCMYWVLNYNDIVMRSGIENQTDLIIGGIGILLVLEATRRMVGPTLSILAGLFILYAYFGNSMPGILQNRGYSLERIIGQLWFTDNGIFGMPLYVSATYVIVFILFGAFLKYSGAGEFFINFAYALTGWRKGGPAKTSVLASGFFGMISGSSIANAVTVGSFTIPLMKKAGYRKEFAGGIEAASSTGGQIMPPVMGAAAFIMVEYIGMPYQQIIISAIIPAIAFFTGVWIMAHLEAGRVGLKSVPKAELPDWKKLLIEKGYVSISVFLLLYLILAVNLSVAYSGVFSIISIIALSYVPDLVRLFRERKHTTIAGLGIAFVAAFGIIFYVLSSIEMLKWLGISKMVSLPFVLFSVDFPLMAFFYSIIAVIIPAFMLCFFMKKPLQGMDFNRYRLALEEGTKGASGVALACATAGIISGIATMTGLGMKIAMMVSTVAGNELLLSIPWVGPALPIFVAMLLTMIACLILGMGLPTTATYIVLVTMAVPALTAPGMHVPYEGVLAGAAFLLPLHMFVFYYGVLADVTPPVALAAYAAAGIAKSNQFWTGIEAFKISLNKLMVPFAFVYSPSILMLGINWSSPMSLGGAAFDISTMFIGILALHASVMGYWMTHMGKLERAIMFAAALGLIFPNLPGAVFGIAVMIASYVLQKRKIRVKQEIPALDSFKKPV
jgi:TRAP transporter 4TM/12TM fusion protein